MITDETPDPFERRRAWLESVSAKNAQLGPPADTGYSPPPSTAADDLADLERRHDEATDDAVRAHLARMIAAATAPPPVSHGDADAGARGGQPTTSTRAERIREAERAGNWREAGRLKTAALLELDDPSRSRDVRF